MKISSVSSNCSGNQTAIDSKNEIKLLQKQKAQLQEQIRKINQNEDLDSKTKQDNIKVLKEQIKFIDAEIQQKQTEKLNKNSKPQQNETLAAKGAATNMEPVNTGIDCSKMNSLIEADVTYSKAEVLKGMKTEFEGRSGVLTQEIELDESRGVDPEAKISELQNIKVNTWGMDRDLGKSLQTAVETLQTDEEVPEETAAKMDPEKDDEKKDSVSEAEPEKSSGTVWIVKVDDKNKKVDVTA